MAAIWKMGIQVSQSLHHIGEHFFGCGHVGQRITFPKEEDSNRILYQEYCVPKRAPQTVIFSVCFSSTLSQLNKTLEKYCDISHLS